MKIIAYAVRPDELDSFEYCKNKFKCDLTIIRENFTVDNAPLAKDHDAVIILSNGPIAKETFKIIHDLGIKYISLRSAGYNDVDLGTTKELGIQVANVPAYSPNSVGDFTVLSALSMIRNYPTMLKRTAKQDYSLGGLIGKEIRNMTLGFVGAGRIGQRAMESFAGLNPQKILAYDLYERDEVKQIADYVSLDELFAQSDLISFHTNLSEDTYHLINNKNIAKMKDGVYLVNTSRGGICNTTDLLDALDSEKIAGYATDVYEHEAGILFVNHEGKRFDDPIFQRLHDHPKAIVSPHCAFYTDEAVSNMVEYSIQNVHDFFNTGSCVNEVFTQ